MERMYFRIGFDLFLIGALFITGIYHFGLYILRRKERSTMETLSDNLRRYLQELEEKNIRLRRVDQIKDDFLVTTTHELKTPLHGIIGIAESLLEDAKTTGKIQVENLKMIISSARRLSELVNNILDYSKMKNQDLKLNIKPVDVRPIVELVLSLLKPLAEAKQLALENRISEDAPLILADEDRVKQIIFNLAGNAVKFTDAGQITVSALVNDGQLAITVADTGLGIPEDRLEVIFEPFGQIISPERTGYDGVGLGLSITKNLVEMHGGTVTVASEVGKGSLFTFTIPLSDASEASEAWGEIPEIRREQPERLAPVLAKTQDAIDQSGDQSVMTILIADDELINLQVIINMLAAENLQMVTAANGLEVLEKVKSGLKPDLVILDIMMPKMSGYEVCRRLRERYSLFEMPVLMVTARSRAEDILAGFEVGANDYLSKPFDRQELRARIKTQLELKKAAEQVITTELRFLQAQIKPHFLYNALNSIIALCRLNPEKAGEVLLELSTYLRRSFDFKSTAKFVPLGQELELVTAYLAIEQVRFIGKLNVVYDIDREINLNIPPLMLQPIVENAVRHGLITKAEGGTVRISVKDTTDYVLLIVEDDGVGIAEAKMVDIFSQKDTAGSGVGLVNIYKRMNALYGYGPAIKSEVGKGTQITLKIPRTRTK
jgi:two-component system sensor histidine kinase ChiS